jgi:hypothetical protein
MGSKNRAITIPQRSLRLCGFPLRDVMNAQAKPGRLAIPSPNSSRLPVFPSSCPLSPVSGLRPSRRRCTGRRRIGLHPLRNGSALAAALSLAIILPLASVLFRLAATLPFAVVLALARVLCGRHRARRRRRCAGRIVGRVRRRGRAATACRAHQDPTYCCCDHRACQFHGVLSFRSDNTALRPGRFKKIRRAASDA